MINYVHTKKETSSGMTLCYEIGVVSTTNLFADFLKNCSVNIKENKTVELNIEIVYTT